MYRWRLKPEREEQFVKAWTYVTEQLFEKCGSLGSRLHKGNDGLWYGYAQWPSVEQRETSYLNHAEIVEARQTMREATLESLPEIVLVPVGDFLVLPRSERET